MTEEQIKHMVDRFLMWQLPKDFNPDGGIELNKQVFYDQRAFSATGTNLFTASQAETMIRFMVENLPDISSDVIPLKLSTENPSDSDQPYLFPMSPEEPFFILRGRDPAAVAAISAWILERYRLLDSGVLPSTIEEYEHITKAENKQHEIKRWQPKSFGKPGTDISI